MTIQPSTCTLWVNKISEGSTTTTLTGTVPLSQTCINARVYLACACRLGTALTPINKNSRWSPELVRGLMHFTRPIANLFHGRYLSPILKSHIPVMPTNVTTGNSAWSKPRCDGTFLPSIAGLPLLPIPRQLLRRPCVPQIAARQISDAAIKLLLFGRHAKLLIEYGQPLRQIQPKHL